MHYESHILDAMFVLHWILQRYNLSWVHIRETNARYCYLYETIVWLYTTFFWIQDSFHSQGFNLGYLCLYNSLFRILYEECKHTVYLTRTWVALNFVVATIVLHQWFFFDVHCLIGHGGNLDNMVQPPLQLQAWERWFNHIVKFQGLGSTGPPSNCRVPMLDNGSASFACFVALVAFCAWVDLWVASVQLCFCRTIIHSLTCKPDSCYLVQTIITLFNVVIRADPWSDWLLWCLQVSSLLEQYGCH